MNFVDCSIINVSETNKQSSFETPFEWIKIKLNKRRSKKIELKGELTKIAGKDEDGFDNSSLQNAMFNFPFFLNYKQSNNKLYISDQGNHIIRSIRNISINIGDDIQSSGDLYIEVGHPEHRGYRNGERNTCKLSCPSGFDWDGNDNMYICNETCICKVDSKSNQVSLVAGHGCVKGYKDGKNVEARFGVLKGILCYQQNDHQSPLILYACDQYNHCIRMVDVTNGETTIFAGEGEKHGDENGRLQTTRFCRPWDIVKDVENDHILYISDSWNNKIKMIDMKKGMVTTLVGDKNDTSILNIPQQMQIIDTFIYVACFGFRHCIVRIDKHSKQVTRMKFNNGKKVSHGIWGMAYHELDQCFYICGPCNIYRLE